MLNVTPISAFDDNYIWAIHAPETANVFVVDPGQSEPVEAFLAEHELNLAGILITHHHHDHTEGVAALTTERDIPVYGPEESPFEGITEPLNNDSVLEIFGLPIMIHAVPGHTLDHISYLIDGVTPQLFCGDTLFLAGCGRLFEGSPEQMLAAMHYFRDLPDSTLVYCTHEYSMANLAFAAAVEPNNTHILNCIDKCRTLRQENKETLPSTIEQEKRVNPYMRTDQPDVIAAAIDYDSQASGSETQVFAALREWKNNF